MATRRSNLTEEQKEAKRKEWLETIEADPELFLSLAEETPVGRRMLETIRRAEREQGELGLSRETNEAVRTISTDDALRAIEILDRSQYTRARRDFFIEGPEESQGIIPATYP